MSSQSRREIARLCRAGLDVTSFRLKAIPWILRVVRADAWCWAIADPATLLITGSLADGIPAEAGPPFFRNEYSSRDFLKFVDVARDTPPVGILSHATQDDLSRSSRWREIFGPLGFGDEVRVALVTESWCSGYLVLHRKRNAPNFKATDATFLAEIAPGLADGLRSALLVESAAANNATEVPGLIVLTDELAVLAITPVAKRWLEELEPATHRVGELPDSIFAVAARLRAIEQSSSSEPDQVPKARLRATSGRWLLVQASRLSGPRREGQIAIIVDVAHPVEIAPVVLQAYALTEREGHVARLVMQGLSTKEIGSALRISPLTVQQHLKAVFDKVGVRSRRDLVGRIFTQQYWPNIASGRSPGAYGWFAGAG